MPAAVAVPAIASVVGGGVSYLGQRSAAGASERNSDAALDFAREQEATRRQEYDQQQAAAKQAWDAYQAQLAPYRAAAAGAGEHFGVHTPQSVISGAPDVAAMGAGARQPMTLGALAGMPSQGGAPQPQPMAQAPMAQGPQAQPLTLGNLANWSDWSNYHG